jgi:MSHA biogenesis protein MshM
MYLDHYNLTDLPFSLTPNTQFYCQLPGHADALNTILMSLEGGDGFIKITGHVGTGKTMLCRMLLDTLKEPYVTAYIPNPDLNPMGIRKALAAELGISFEGSIDQYELHDLINSKLIEHYKKAQHVVLIIDEAQTLSPSSLETLRLFSNLQTESSNLLQVVLFGQPQLDDRLDHPDLWQLKQRIVFSRHLKALSRRELEAYINHRLVRAGYTHGLLFSKKSIDVLYRATQGIPRLVNILCHKALMAGFGLSLREVNKRVMNMAVKDTESVSLSMTSSWIIYGAGAIAIILVGFAAIFHAHLGLHL